MKNVKSQEERTKIKYTNIYSCMFFILGEGVPAMTVLPCGVCVVGGCWEACLSSGFRCIRLISLHNSLARGSKLLCIISLHKILKHRHSRARHGSSE